MFGLSQGARGPIVSTMTTRIFRGSALSMIHGALWLAMSVGAAGGTLLAGIFYDTYESYLLGSSVSVMFIIVAALPFWVSDRLRQSQFTGSAVE